jgi:hypothetical protein
LGLFCGTVIQSLQNYFMKTISSLLFAFFIFASCATHAQHGKHWNFVADKWVSYGIDHDVINTGNYKDDFRKLVIRVTDGPLKMYEMKVYFDNGTMQDVSLQRNFSQGEESRVIDLDGGLRHISRIEFWYETKGYKKGKARVAVWGAK